MNYYNEIDPYCVQWLKNLIAAGLIPNGHVDDRSIRDVQPGDLAGFTQCHFFAGIAGWSLALSLAEWPEDREVWTGSCPCQPFSSAGARKGFEDDRHLWPEFHRLIRECSPPIIFGEQVARAADWLRLVRSDLEALDYAVGAMPIEAASVGAPHKRDRFWFGAFLDDHGHGQHALPVHAEVARASQPIPHPGSAELRQQPRRSRWPNGTGTPLPGVDGTARSLANAYKYVGYQGRAGDVAEISRGRDTHRSGFVADVSLASGEGLALGQGEAGQRPHAAVAGSDWWAVEPDVGRVAHGVSARVGKLRAFGNAIVPQVAAEFIRAAT